MLDVPGAGVVLAGAKMIGLWAGVATLVVSDVVVFDPATLFGSLGALLIILGTVWMTFRTNAVKFWRDTAEARGQRVSQLEESLRKTIEESEAALRKKSEEKHAALSELAGEKMKHDLTPLLQSQADVNRALLHLQEGMELRHQAQADIAEALNKLSDGQIRIVTAQAEQQKVLAQIADNLARQSPPNRRSQR